VVAPDPVASEAIALSCTAAMAAVEDPEPVTAAARVTVAAAAMAAVDDPAPVTAAAMVTVAAAAMAAVEDPEPVAAAARVTVAAAAMAVVDDPAPVAVAARVRAVPVLASRNAICSDPQSSSAPAILKVAGPEVCSSSSPPPMAPRPLLLLNVASIVGKDVLVKVPFLASPTNATCEILPEPVTVPRRLVGHVTEPPAPVFMVLLEICVPAPVVVTFVP